MSEDKKFEWTDDTVKEYINWLKTNDGSDSMFGGSLMKFFKRYKELSKERSSIPLDYEILSCMAADNCSIHPYQKDRCLGADKTVQLCKIHSVRRLSDGEIFSVREKANEGDNPIGYTIKKFEVEGHYVMVSFEEHNTKYNLCLLKKVKQPIQKPPLGLRPRYILDEHRLKEINEAIERYLEANLPIPEGWLKERNSLLAVIKTKD